MKMNRRMENIYRGAISSAAEVGNEMMTAAMRGAIDQYPEIAECQRAARRMKQRNMSILVHAFTGR